MQILLLFYYFRCLTQNFIYSYHHLGFTLTIPRTVHMCGMEMQATLPSVYRIRKWTMTNRKNSI